MRGRRKELGLSQTDLARQIGISRQWVSAFETGKPGAELRLVMALLDALGLGLWVGDEKPSAPPEERSPVDLDALLDLHRDR